MNASPASLADFQGFKILNKVRKREQLVHSPSENLIDDVDYCVKILMYS